MQLLRKIFCWYWCSKSSFKIDLEHVVICLGVASAFKSLKSAVFKKCLIFVLKMSSTEVKVYMYKPLKDAFFSRESQPGYSVLLCH